MKLSDIVPPAKGGWRLLTEQGSDDALELLEAFKTLKLRQGEIAGWLILFNRASSYGPKDLPSGNRHQIDTNNEIWELIKGDHRVAFFYDDDKIVVCTNIFRKKSKKTPKRETSRAIKMKERYFQAKADGSLNISGEGNE